MTDPLKPIDYKAKKATEFTKAVRENLQEVVTAKFGDAVVIPQGLNLVVGQEVWQQLLKDIDDLTVPVKIRPTAELFFGLPVEQSENLPLGGYVLRDGKGEIVRMGNIYDS